MKGWREWQGWRYTVSVVEDDEGKIAWYKIQFLKKRNEWFDEVRYDSHEHKHGRERQLPHLHIKLESVFKKDREQAVEEIKQMITTRLPGLREAIGHETHH